MDVIRVSKTLEIDKGHKLEASLSPYTAIGKSHFALAVLSILSQ